MIQAHVFFRVQHTDRFDSVSYRGVRPVEDHEWRPSTRKTMTMKSNDSSNGDQHQADEEANRQSFLSSLRGWTESNKGYDHALPGRPTQGTCDWIFKDRVFKYNLMGAEESRLLFITGISGCGKSFLAKHMRDNLASRYPEQNHILAFFCNSNNIREQTDSLLLQYFVFQLMQHCPILYRFATLNWRDRTANSPTLCTEALVAILKNILKYPRLGKVVLIIDGLDECDPSSVRDLMQSLTHMLEDESPTGVRKMNQLKIVITCRETDEIEDWYGKHLHLEIKPQHVRHDISLFVKEAMGRIARDWGLSRSIESGASNLIESRANGMFLWARNVLKELESRVLDSWDTVVDIIWECPRIQKEYYRKTLHEFSLTAGPDLKQLMSVAFGCKRPLNVSELADILKQDYGPLSPSQVLKKIRRSCSKLMQINEQGEVMPIHYSLREYLDETQNALEEAEEFARLCIRYLTRDCFRLPPRCVSQEIPGVWRERRLKSEHPFLQYAATFWPDYVRRSGRLSQGTIDSLQNLFSADFPFYETWLQVTSWLSSQTLPRRREHCPVLITLAKHNLANVLLQSEYASVGHHQSWITALLQFASSGQNTGGTLTQFRIGEPFNVKASDGTTVLHEACAANSLNFISAYIENKVCGFEDRVSNGNTALHIAAAGKTDALKLLLASGACNDIRGKDDLTPLMVACASDHDEGARMLLEHGADPSVELENGVTALSLAIAGDRAEQVRLLIEHGAKLDGVSSELYPHISCAIAIKGKEIFELLLDRVDLTLRSGNGRGYSAIHEAACENSPYFVRRLLCREEVDVNSPGSIHDDGTGSLTSVEIAVAMGNAEVLEELLLAGASAQVRNQNGDTPLISAVSANRKALCEILLHYQCDINALNSNAMNAVRLAACNNRKDILALLLDHGAEAEIKDRPDCAQPLHGAAYNGHSEIVQMLLSSEDPPNLNALHAGTTSLCYAASQGHKETVKVLLSYQPDLELADIQTTPLLTAVSGGYEEIVTMLLDQGARPLGHKSCRLTPLHTCAVKNLTGVAKLLLEREPSILDFETIQNSTPLFQACLSGNYELARLLLDHGASTTIRHPSAKWSLVHAACTGGNLRLVVSMFMLTGLDVEHTSITGETPLMLAATGCRMEVFYYLIRRGANVQQTNASGLTLLHLISTSKSANSVKVLEMLIRPPYRLDVNQCDDGQRSPLLYASQCGNDHAVELLLRHGADPSICETTSLWSPLDVAIIKGHDQVVKHLLRSEQTNLFNQDFKGRTALHLALGLGKRSTVNLLFAETFAEPGQDAIVKSPTFGRSWQSEVLKIQDNSGRTPCDYVLPGSVSTSSNARALNQLRRRSRKDVTSQVEGLLNGFKPEDMRFESLAKSLLYLDDEPNAFYAYQRGVGAVLMDGSWVVQHKAYCDNCKRETWDPPIRYVCRVCIDNDLCPDCIVLYKQGKCNTQAHCVDHDFFEAHPPSMDMEDYEYGHFRMDAAEVYDWLRRLADKYVRVPLSRANTEVPSESPACMSPAEDLIVQSLERLGKICYRPVPSLSTPYSIGIRVEFPGRNRMASAGHGTRPVSPDRSANSTYAEDANGATMMAIENSLFSV